MQMKGQAKLTPSQAVISLPDREEKSHATGLELVSDDQ